MKYSKLILPFTTAVMATKGEELPVNEQALSVKDRLFLFDNVMSEMGEFLAAPSEAEEIDALVDAIIYITDFCLRFGFSPTDCKPLPHDYLDKVDKVMGVLKGCATFVERGDLASLEDLLWVIESLCEHDLLPFVEKVAEANMQKVKNGKVVLNERGKVLKPDNFVNPDLEKILRGLKDVD